MPESVTDRCTKAHEYIFLLTKSAKYYYNAEAIFEKATTDIPIVEKHGGGRGSAILQGKDTGKDNYGSIGYSGEGNKRNKRSVWTANTQPYSQAHFATFPPKLIEPCILAVSSPSGTVLDPFLGSGTTGEVAQKLGRNYIGIDLNENYKELQLTRTAQLGLILE